MAFAVSTDYSEEVLVWMRSKEEGQLAYDGISPQINLRGALVDFIRIVCEELKQSVLTTHLSVCLLDKFMDNHSISNNQLRLTGLAVVLLASKFEERDNNIPRVSDLNAFADKRYSITIFRRMEVFMLKFFEWKVGFVTAAHFAELFLIHGVTIEDSVYNNVDASTLHLLHRKLWYSTQHYLDISLQDVAFLKWKASKVAAACMACGRIHQRLVPTWPPSLHVVSGYAFVDLEGVIILLQSKSEVEERVCKTPDSGYQSVSPGMSGSTISPCSSNSL